MGFQGYFSCRYYLTPFWVFLFTPLSFSFYPMLFCWFYFLDMKAVKELYEKKTRKEDRRPRCLLYFDFIAGFNNLSV